MIKTDNIEIRFKHWVPVELDGEARFGTQCSVTLDGTKHEGCAIVHPSDQYCKRTGRKVALKHALAALPRTKRGLVWDVYRARKMFSA